VLAAFQALQFTPDLLPGDITGGTSTTAPKTSSNCVKARCFPASSWPTEINRASPRTQSALLEAMQEYQVTLEGETMEAAPSPSS